MHIQELYSGHYDIQPLLVNQTRWMNSHCDKFIVVADAVEKGSGDAEQMHATLALSLARHAAIPQGQVLNNDEMEQLVNELFSCSNVNYTPDGRAILSILPQQDIEQLLG